MESYDKVILLLADNPGIEAEVAAALDPIGDLAFRSVATFDEVVASMAEVRVEGILLDATLSRNWPATYCRSLRLSGIKVPIIVVMAEFDPATYCALLEAGASSCILCPIRRGVLLARLAVTAQRLRDGCLDMLIVGRFRFFTRERVLREPGTSSEIELEEKECRVLTMLYAARGRIVGRSTLELTIWGSGDGSGQDELRERIASLRRKIEMNPALPRVLLEEQEGYRLVTISSDGGAEYGSLDGVDSWSRRA